MAAASSFSSSSPEATSRAEGTDGSVKDSASSSSPSASVIDRQQQRLFQLRLKLNAGRRDNAREAKEELQRMAAAEEGEGGGSGSRGSSRSGPSQSASGERRRRPSKRPRADAEHKERGEDGSSSRRQRAERPEEKMDPDILPLLLEPAASAEQRYREQRRKERRKQGLPSDDDDDELVSSSSSSRPAPPGSRAVLDNETASRRYERRLSRVKAATGSASVSGVSASRAAAQSAAALSSFGSVSGGYVDRIAPSETAIDRLVADLESSQQRAAAFSRRRTVDPAEDVSYINDRNRAFNKKAAAYFDKYTLETAQNIERGTAL